MRSGRSVSVPYTGAKIMEDVAVDGPVSTVERMALAQYPLDGAYDEMFAAEKELHPHYAPLVEMLRALARELGADELERLLGAARAEIGRLVPEVGNGNSDPSAGEFEASRMLELIIGVLGRLAADRPLMLVFEDVQWADSATLDLLGLLVAQFLTRNFVFRMCLDEFFESADICLWGRLRLRQSDILRRSDFIAEPQRFCSQDSVFRKNSHEVRLVAHNEGCDSGATGFLHCFCQ